jgi:hypothetical protein
MWQGRGKPKPFTQTGARNLTGSMLSNTPLCRAMLAMKNSRPASPVHRVGGHTMGLQVTRVWTRRGWVVLASDATHFYANMRQTRPFPIVFDVGEMVAGSETFNRLASSPDHIVPSHDPLALECYPAAKPGLEGIVARLDVDPSMPPS